MLRAPATGFETAAAQGLGDVGGLHVDTVTYRYDGGVEQTAAKGKARSGQDGKRVAARRAEIE